MPNKPKEIPVLVSLNHEHAQFFSIAQQPELYPNYIRNPVGTIVPTTLFVVRARPLEGLADCS